MSNNRPPSRANSASPELEDFIQIDNEQSVSPKLPPEDPIVNGPQSRPTVEIENTYPTVEDEENKNADPEDTMMIGQDEDVQPQDLVSRNKALSLQVDELTATNIALEDEKQALKQKVTALETEIAVLQADKSVLEKQAPSQQTQTAAASSSSVSSSTVKADKAPSLFGGTRSVAFAADAETKKRREKLVSYINNWSVDGFKSYLEKHSDLDVNFIDPTTGLSPLMLAIHIKSAYGLPMTDILLKRGADVTLTSTKAMVSYGEREINKGANALFFYVNHYNLGCPEIKERFDLMIQSPTLDLNATDSKGKTILHVATKTGYELTIQYLVEKGCDITKTDNKGRTPYNKYMECSHYPSQDVANLLSGSSSWSYRR